jgi:hypothetical protein
MAQRFESEVFFLRRRLARHTWAGRVAANLTTWRWLSPELRDRGGDLERTSGLIPAISLGMSDELLRSG